jgi:hypothetical protein
MKSFEFSIIASGLDRNAEDFESRFIEAGCDDATISWQKGVIILDFDRDAHSFAHAIASAFQDVGRAGAHVIRVEPDHLVSLSDVAARSKMTRAAASLYAKGERGEGFPAPAVRVTCEHSLWDWYEVAQWLHRRGKLSRDEVIQARLVREANLYVDSRNLPRDAFINVLEAAERELEDA